MRRVVSDALGMFRLGRTRVVVVALVLFGLPALLGSVAQEYLDGLTTPPGLLATTLAVTAVLVATTLRLFGPVVFTGYLDEAVGREYLFGHRTSFREVLRSLPWIRLLIADLILGLGAVFGLVLLIVPGLIIYTLFGLVGPVIVQERRTLWDGFRRTYRISRTALLPVFLLVLVPVIVEQLVHGFAEEAVHHAWFPIQFVVEWLVAALIGGAVGLLEVALAAELMARNPEPLAVANEVSPA
jgi:hypothetical protein